MENLNQKLITKMINENDLPLFEKLNKKMSPCVAFYRTINKKSRAISHTHWAKSSGVVRRATCIYCRQIVATSSAKYPETKTSFELRKFHGENCSKHWLQNIINNTK